MTDVLINQDTPVIQKTKELCAVLLEQESFQRLKTKLDAFLADEGAQQRYQALGNHQQRLMNRQQAGEDLSDEEISAFEDEREALLLDPVSGGFVEAQQGFEEFRDTVVRYLNKTFELGRVPSAEDVKPKGGCCGGGCSCGSGGCS